MAELYYYIPREKINDIVDCGLKLSEWYDREILLPGFNCYRKVLKAFLNPRDDLKKVKDANSQCLRLEVDLDYCRVGDAALYDMGLKEPVLMENYIKNLIPLADYKFGAFRNPEVLIMVSLLPDKIDIAGKALDIPVLYESSEILYLNNLLEKQEETYQDSGNHLLYAFFIYLEAMGKVIKHTDDEKKNVIFFYKDINKYIVLRIPSKVE